MRTKSDPQRNSVVVNGRNLNIHSIYWLYYPRSSVQIILKSCMKEVNMPVIITCLIDRHFEYLTKLIQGKFYIYVPCNKQ